MEKPDKRLENAFLYLRKKGLVKYKKDVAQTMNVATDTVSRAFSGIKPYYNPTFLRAFNSAFDNIFNERWLMGEDVPMLSESETQKQPEPTTPTDSIITLAATLIQETELLHRQLSDEIAQVSALRQELTDTLAYLRTNFPTPAYPSTFPSTHYLAEAPDDSTPDTA